MYRHLARPIVFYFGRDGADEADIGFFVGLLAGRKTVLAGGARITPASYTSHRTRPTVRLWM
jgi:hypothetical protein